VHITARQLSDNIDDTVMVADSEACRAALTFYSAVKAAAAQNIPNAKAMYDDLKARFPTVKHNPNMSISPSHISYCAYNIVIF
jgi:hypothetical protein